MSTNKTPNLQLHAWEPTDAFSRAEFNDNFAALDAAAGELTALKAKVAALERKSFRQHVYYQTPHPCNYIANAFLNQDWNQFSRVHFVMVVYTTAACTLYPYVYTDRKPDSFQVSASDTPRRTTVHITFFPGYHADDPAWATIACEDHCVTRVFDFPFRDVEIAGVEVGDNRILAGSSITIYSEG